MDIKRFIIAGVVVYVVYQILGFLIHEVILSGPYASLESLWRPEEKTWIFWLTGLLWAALFTFIYTKGYEGKGVMEGEPIEDNGKYIVILQKQPDNAWKIARDIWNSDNPVSGAAGENN
ncbi:hypothetical protein MYX78_11520 [Acidobacteria bacterium AH-259-G07]|nr:hypothetical protein [Acidobacteria bacterium AH-259-G07]